MTRVTGHFVETPQSSFIHSKKENWSSWLTRTSAFHARIKMLEICTQNSDHQLLCRGQAPEQRLRSHSHSCRLTLPQDLLKWSSVEAWWRALWWPPSCWLWCTLDQQVRSTFTHSRFKLRQPGTRLTCIGFSSADKLAQCCTTVSKTPIKEPITGYMIQKPHPPCVPAVMWVNHLQQWRHILHRWICQFWERSFALPAAFKQQQAFTAFRSTLTGSKPGSLPLSKFIKHVSNADVHLFMARPHLNSWFL